MAKLELLYTLAWGLAAVALVSGESCTKRCSAYAHNYCECSFATPCNEEGGTCMTGPDGKTYCEGECELASWLIAIIIIVALGACGCGSFCIWKCFAINALAVRQNGEKHPRPHRSLPSCPCT